MVREGSYMAGRVARVSEVVAGSPKSFDDAVKIAFDRANKTLRNITGMKIVDMSVNCDAGKILEYRVRAEVIFILE
jgi:flavin-binding protein dodecin